MVSGAFSARAAALQPSMVSMAPWSHVPDVFDTARTICPAGHARGFTKAISRAWAAASHSAMVVMSALQRPVVTSAPASLTCPGGHEFAVKASHAAAPLPDMRPLAHVLQVALDIAPVLPEKRPAVHASQVALDVAPVLLEKCPVAHASHAAVPLLDL
jgi:hypothetical protein